MTEYGYWFYTYKCAIIYLDLDFLFTSLVCLRCLCFWKKFLKITEAAFISSKMQKHKIIIKSLMHLCLLLKKHFFLLSMLKTVFAA